MLPILHPTTRADGIAVLLTFHGRIRAALAELGALSTTEAGTPAWRRRADDLLTFLRGAFVWHDLNEEVCLVPLLMTRSWSPEVERMLTAMSTSHEGMEGQLEPLAELLGKVAGGLHVDGPLLDARASMFIAYVEMSLAGEERLFAAVKVALTTNENAQLAAEMSACDAARSRRFSPGDVREDASAARRSS